MKLIEVINDLFLKVESGSEDLMRPLQSEVKELREENERYKLSIEENEELKISLEARLAVALQDAKDAEELQQELQLCQMKIKVSCLIIFFFLSFFLC